MHQISRHDAKKGEFNESQRVVHRPEGAEGTLGVQPQ
jgi:hypothetical protein